MSRKGFRGVLVDGQLRLIPHVHQGRERLGRGDVHPQGREARHAEQLGARARGHVRPDVGVARRHDAVEGRPDVLEGLEGFQSVYDGLVSDHRGLALMVSAGGGVEVLRRDHVGFQKRLIATVGDLRQIPRGLGDPQLRLRLGELLIHRRGVDVGQDLTRLDPGADVEMPGLQVPAGLSEDGRIGVGHGLAGQLKLDHPGVLLRMDDPHHQARRFVSPLLKRRRRSVSGGNA